MKTLHKCVTLLFAAGVAAAQTPSATVLGRLLDPAGAAVAGASVRVRNVDTNEIRTAETQGEGEYSIPALSPGNYELVVEKAGFKLLRQEHLVLQVGQAARVDATLLPTLSDGALSAGRLLAVPVVDGALAVEEGAQAPATRQALSKPKLVGIWVNHDVGTSVATQCEKRHRLSGAVEDLVCALLAERKPHHLTFVEFSDALWRAQRGPPPDHDHHLLIGEVEVVGVGGLAGWYPGETRGTPAEVDRSRWRRPSIGVEA